MVRAISLGDHLCLHIEEATELDNEAGAVVWDAALVLINYLRLPPNSEMVAFFRHHCHDISSLLLADLKGRPSRAGASITGARVIDLGAGTGAVGLATAALGASSVVLTDLPHLLPLLERNLALNRDAAPAASVAALDWRAPEIDPLHPPFQLILASDVLYQQEVLPHFVATLQALCGPHPTTTAVLLANEHRPKLPFPWPLFKAAGFEVVQVPWEDHHPAWRSEDIHLYRLTLVQHC